MTLRTFYAAFGLAGATAIVVQDMTRWLLDGEYYTPLYRVLLAGAFAGMFAFNATPTDGPAPRHRR
jgi:hypothetical protein